MTTHTQRGTLTASGGAASVNISALYGRLMHIFVKSATATTTFDMSLTDIHGNATFTRCDEVGELNELLDMPVYGNLTFAISDASLDEVFTYIFVIYEG